MKFKIRDSIGICRNDVSHVCSPIGADDMSRKNLIGTIKVFGVKFDPGIFSTKELKHMVKQLPSYSVKPTTIHTSI